MKKSQLSKYSILLSSLFLFSCATDDTELVGNQQNQISTIGIVKDEITKLAALTPINGRSAKFLSTDRHMEIATIDLNVANQDINGLYINVDKFSTEQANYLLNSTFFKNWSTSKVALVLDSDSNSSAENLKKFCKQMNLAYCNDYKTMVINPLDDGAKFTIPLKDHTVESADLTNSIFVIKSFFMESVSGYTEEEINEKSIEYDEAVSMVKSFKEGNNEYLKTTALAKKNRVSSKYDFNYLTKDFHNSLTEIVENNSKLTSIYHRSYNYMNDDYNYNFKARFVGNWHIWTFPTYAGGGINNTRRLAEYEVTPSGRSCWVFKDPSYNMYGKVLTSWAFNTGQGATVSLSKGTAKTFTYGFNFGGQTKHNTKPIGEIFNAIVSEFTGVLGVSLQYSTTYITSETYTFAISKGYRGAVREMWMEADVKKGLFEYQFGTFKRNVYAGITGWKILTEKIYNYDFRTPDFSIHYRSQMYSKDDVPVFNNNPFMAGFSYGLYEIK
jgi:hypothetical protein